ncbi:MAG TPA: sucrase ferredoxin [Candidatus Limnocylindria bacterium]|nr:sucrase ferredoxin [Candidatus Limnocylindria bacterium]
MLDRGEEDLPRSCALAATHANEHPTGWAIAARRFALVEVPLPWPATIEEAAGLPPGLAALLETLNAADPDAAPRLEAVVSEPGTVAPGRRRVVLLERSGGGRPGYTRLERQVAPGEVAELVAAWADGRIEPDASRDVRDIVVCTHGSHDTCCGRFGAPIHRALKVMTAGHPDIRIWRGSHTGGHRFSPTLVDFPDGRSWGRLRPEDLEALVWRVGSASGLRERYRGLGTLPTFYERLVEAELLFRHGWSWLERHVDGEVISGHRFSYPEEPDDVDDLAIVRISSTDPSGSLESWQAHVVRGEDTTTRGECGDEPWDSPSFHVTNLRQVEPTPPLADG